MARRHRQISGTLGGLWGFGGAMGNLRVSQTMPDLHNAFRHTVLIVSSSAD